MRGVVSLIVFFAADAAWFMILPDVSALKTTNPTTTAFMEYRKDEWRDAGRKQAIHWTWTPLSAISRNLITAVTIAEDDKFWEHEGFDLEGMENAMIRNLEGGGPIAGGSTISQQLAKNLYFSPSKNPLRKLNEAIVTWRMERTLSKRRILELYLNCIEWGDGVFGVGAASRRYFGKRPSQLTRPEAALLAAVLPNPLRWSPLGQSKGVNKRAKLIMQRMDRRMDAQERYRREQEEKKRAREEATKPASAQ